MPWRLAARCAHASADRFLIFFPWPHLLLTSALPSEITRSPGLSLSIGERAAPHPNSDQANIPKGVAPHRVFPATRYGCVHSSGPPFAQASGPHGAREKGSHARTQGSGLSRRITRESRRSKDSCRSVVAVSLARCRGVVPGTIPRSRSRRPRRFRGRGHADFFTISSPFRSLYRRTVPLR